MPIRPHLAPPLLLLLATACCNPYRHAGQLPAARCRVDRDCSEGRTCRQGLCALAAWVTGRLRRTDGALGRAAPLELLVVPDGSLGPAGLDPAAPVLGRRTVAARDGLRYRFDALPTGRFQVIARCPRKPSAIAGLAAFVVDGTRGYLPAPGGSRELEVDLAVTPGYCGGRSTHSGPAAIGPREATRR